MKRKRRNFLVEIPQLWQPRMRFSRLLQLVFPRPEYDDLWEQLKVNKRGNSTIRSFMAAMQRAGFERNHADVVVQVCWVLRRMTTGEVLSALPCFRSKQEAFRYLKKHNIDSAWVRPARMEYHVP